MSDWTLADDEKLILLRKHKFTFREIGKRLGKPTGTCCSRYHKLVNGKAVTNSMRGVRQASTPKQIHRMDNQCEIAEALRRANEGHLALLMRAYARRAARSAA